MTMITPSYLGETIEYSSLHACRSTLEDPTIRGQILREHGYSVVLYHRPLEVLHCDLSMFDIAILDFEMPDLSGPELLLRMRALGARFPVVLLTGLLATLSHEDFALFARCIDKGMPVNYLLDTIANLLDPPIPDYGS